MLDTTSGLRKFMFVNWWRGGVTLKYKYELGRILSVATGLNPFDPLRKRAISVEEGGR